MHSTKFLTLSTLAFLLSSTSLFAGDKSTPAPTHSPLLISTAALATPQVKSPAQTRPVAIVTPERRASSAISPRARAGVLVTSHSYPPCVQLFPSESLSTYMYRPITPAPLARTSSHEATIWP